MAHTSRKQYFDYLQNMLPHAELFVDDGSLKIYGNCIRCWEHYNPMAQYHCVIQDDVIFTDNFHDKVSNFLKEHGDKSNIFSLYLDKRPLNVSKIEKSKRNNQGYIQMPHINHEIALIFKTSIINDMLAYAKSHPEHSDKFLRNWAKLRGYHVIYSLPCLIEHRNGDSLHNDNNVNSKFYKAVWF